MTTWTKTAVSGVLLLAALNAGAQSGWSLTRLPALLNGYENSAEGAVAVSNAGQIVGQSNWRAVLWDGGRVTDLGSLRTDLGYNVARGINDAGQVVGMTEMPDGNLRGALWQGGRITELAPLPGYQTSGATAVNAFGTVVGYSNNGSAAVPTLWKAGRPTDLGVPAGFESGGAIAINTSGQIVLWDDFGPSFVGRSGSFTNLGFLSADQPVTKAWSINDSGQVVGVSGSHAFVWDEGHMRDLGVPAGFSASEATAINEAGQVVGYASRWGPLTHDTIHAILWDGDRMVDLNAQLGGAAADWLIYPRDINDAGVIVGRALDSSRQSFAFMLTPIPEPGTPALLLAGGVLVWRLRRRAAARFKDAQRSNLRYAL